MNPENKGGFVEVRDSRVLVKRPEQAGVLPGLKPNGSIMSRFDPEITLFQMWQSYRKKKQDRNAVNPKCSFHSC